MTSMVESDKEISTLENVPTIQEDAADIEEEDSP